MRHTQEEEEISLPPPPGWALSYGCYTTLGTSVLTNNPVTGSPRTHHASCRCCMWEDLSRVQDAPLSPVGARLPERLHARFVERIMPMLLSINPMGTPLFLPQTVTSDIAAVMDGAPMLGQQPNGETEDTGSLQRRSTAARAATIAAYLHTDVPVPVWEDRVIRRRHLSGARRTSPVLQNEVGLLVHTAMNTDLFQGFRLWVNWIHGHLNQPINHQIYCELVHQWRSFAQHTCQSGTAMHAEIRLHSMVEADCSPEDWTAFLNELRSQDHSRRRRQQTMPPSAGNWETTLRTMGTMTHMDIARWAFHALRGRVCCTSTAGRGLWYLYVPDKHRWVFDRDGPNVLLEAFRVVRQHLEEL